MAGLYTGKMGLFPSYAEGGMVGPGGMPEPVGMQSPIPQPMGPTPPGLAPQASDISADPRLLESQVNQFASQQPQQIAQIQQAILQAVQSGELTQQELNMMVQLATVAAQNPDMYPYVRNFAIQQGLATEQDLPVEYDQGLVFVLLLAARALQTEMGEMEEGPEMEEGQAVPSMARGGMTPKSKKKDGSVLINAHEGEYVIPAKVVKMKGKEFFDNLVEKYKTA